MRVQNLTENVVLHVQRPKPIDGAFILDKPLGGVSKLDIPDDDALAAEIRNPDRPEKSKKQLEYNTEDFPKFLMKFRKMHADALRTQDGLEQDRVLHLLQ